MSEFVVPYAAWLSTDDATGLPDWFNILEANIDHMYSAEYYQTFSQVDRYTPSTPNFVLSGVLIIPPGHRAVPSMWLSYAQVEAADLLNVTWKYTAYHAADEFSFTFPAGALEEDTFIPLTTIFDNSGASDKLVLLNVYFNAAPAYVFTTYVRASFEIVPIP